MVVNQELEITHLPISDLRPDPANPRRISDEELESLTRSIREFGLIDPIIARRDDKVVIGGHQRLLAARKLGLKHVPVVLVDLSEEQAHLLNLALNRISGSWDQELLARLLSDLSAVPDVDLSLSGFSDEELQKHLHQMVLENIIIFLTLLIFIRMNVCRLPQQAAIQVKQVFQLIPGV